MILLYKEAERKYRSRRCLVAVSEAGALNVEEKSKLFFRNFGRVFVVCPTIVMIVLSKSTV